jgi:hypothetical protein
MAVNGYEVTVRVDLACGGRLQWIPDPDKDMVNWYGGTPGE